jgi:hypothetical protein
MHTIGWLREFVMMWPNEEPELANCIEIAELTCCGLLFDYAMSP